MKIVFFLGLPNPFPGAGWTRISFFARFFRRKGHKVYILGAFTPRSFNKAQSKNVDGVNIFNLTPMTVLYSPLTLMFNVLSSIITLVPVVLALKPEMMIISVPNGEPAIGVHLASRLAGAKIIYDYRDEWEDSTINRAKSKLSKLSYRLLKRIMTRLYMSRVITVTPYMARNLEMRGVKEVKLLPNGADTTIFKPHDKASIRERLGLEKDDFIVVYSGGIGGYYRLDVVVRALANLNDSYKDNVKLVMVGGGELPAVLKIANDLRLNEKVIYLGVKDDRREIAEIISAGDLAIIPYDNNPLWKNTIPAKFFEYCACGVPVVAAVHYDSILAKIINEYRVGLVVPPMNSAALAEAIYNLYKDSMFRTEISENAVSLVVNHYDRNKIAKDFLRLLEDMD